MKKLILFLFVLVSYYGAICQPVTQRSSKTITVMDARSGAIYNMYLPRYYDTTEANLSESIGIDTCGAMIFTYINNGCWFRQCSPKKWVMFGSTNGNNGSDTLFAQLPAFFDSTTRAPNTILKILQANGLFSGGVVTLDSCMTVDVTRAVYFLNYLQYTSAQVIGLTVSPADVFDRTDAVVADSNLNVYIRKGLTGGLAPYINPSSEVLLATIPVPANATCLPITQEIIFDGASDNPAQWTPTTSGTLSNSFTNTDNPFHLNQAAYTVTYEDSSQLIFTKPSGTDTAKATSIVKMYLYFVGGMLNQLKGQWYNGTTAVSNVISLNPYFNPNDSNEYQIVAPSLSAWNFTNNEFNKLVLTFGGSDLAGSKGIYNDWIQLQTGINNVATQLMLTTNGSSGAATLIDNVLNIPIYSGGGGGGGGNNIYNIDSSLAGNRALDLNDFTLRFSEGANDFLLINPTLNNEGIDLRAVNPTGGTNASGFSASTTDVNASTIFYANFNDGAKLTSISAFADVTTQALTYTADTHTFNGTTFQFNTIDSIGGIQNALWVDNDGFLHKGSVVISDNGLTKTDNNIQLGGTLIVPTQIFTDNTNSLTFIGTGSSSAVSIINNVGNGAEIDGTSNGLQTQTSSDGFYGLLAANVNDDLLDGVSGVINVFRAAASGPQPGFGGSIDFTMNTIIGSGIANQIISQWTDVNNVTRTSQLSFTGSNSGVLQNLLTISGAGIFTLTQSLPSYVNNAAAISGGLTAGQLYRISVAGTSTVAIVE